MDSAQAIDILTRFQAWRRYDGDYDQGPDMPDSIEIGKALDFVISNWGK